MQLSARFRQTTAGERPSVAIMPNSLVDARDSSPPEDQHAFAQSFLATVDSGDLDELERRCTEDVELRAGNQEVVAGWPAVHQVTSHVIDLDGSTATCRAHVHATHRLGRLEGTIGGAFWSCGGHFQ